MAKLARGFDQTNLRGSVGAVTYRRVGNVTIASQKVPMNVKAKQTNALMRVRMRWANLVAMWQTINKTSWHPSFIRDNKRVSDFNRFMSINMAATPVYLTRNIVAIAGGVVANYVVTEGNLPTIGVEFDSNIPSADIALGTLNLGASTTLKAFSEAIVNNNNGWQHGDKLTVLIVRQLQDATSQLPYMESHAEEVTLDTSDSAATKLLKDYFDTSLIAVSDGYLALSGPVTGGVAFVHSRIVDGETVCSRQALVTNNTTVLSEYTGNTAYLNACATYGGLAVAQTLTPDLNQEPDVNVNP